MSNYQKKQSNFKGLTLKVFQNKYKQKPTSYDFKGDGDEFFLKKLGQWLKSPEIVQERKTKPLKIGVRTVEQDNKRDGGTEQVCEITFYIGQPKQSNPRSYHSPISNDEMMDDELPKNENGEDIF